MFEFIQPLEARRLFSISSITAADLAADKTVVVTDAADLKTALTAFYTDNKATLTQIADQFKTLPKSDEALLKSLQVDVSASKTTLQKDMNTLASKVLATVNRSLSAGDAVLRNANDATLKTLAKDITALQSVTSAPLATLTSDLGNTALTGNLDAVIIALSSDTALITSVNAQLSELSANDAAVTTAATQFNNAVNKLAADQATVQTDLGTYPSLIGTYTGPALDTAGKHKGDTIEVTLSITSEVSTTGAVAGTITDLATGGTDVLTGSVTLDGKVSIKALTINDGTLVVSGQAVLPVISGKFSTRSSKGTLTVTET